MNTRLKHITLSLSVLLALGLSACTPASKDAKTKSKGDETAAISKDPLNNVQSIVEKSSQGNFRVVKLFDVPGVGGMKGALLEPRAGGQKILGWTNDKGEFFIPGPFYNDKAEDISKQMMEKYGDQVPPAQIADEAQNTGFVAGTAGPVITVFFEPYCGYCNRLFQALEPLIAKGQLRARFLMVGFLHDDSLARAADIVNAKDPYAALVKWENLPDKTKAKPSTASQEQQGAITKNNLLMNKAGQAGTPAILFCSKDKGVQMVSGLPQDLNGLLNNISSEGHPSCK